MFRALLCSLGEAIRTRLVEARDAHSSEQLASVAHDSEADTIYAIDKISESAIREWFAREWPVEEPVEVVMEGVEEGSLCFPEGVSASATKWKCLIDPIDGTRGIMYDKRSAWALAGLAPQRGAQTRLSDVWVASMTELPVSKAWRADQFSAIRGEGVVAESRNLLTGESHPLGVRPSRAKDFHHGFASLVKFFPEGRVLTSRIEERLWEQLHGLGVHASPTVFDDQYISTGGQFYELLTGHDRMIGDIRPLVLPAAGFPASLVCHPYDAVAWPVLAEAGVVFEHPLGGFPDAPLDTTSPVAWVAWANQDLAALARPALRAAIERTLGEVKRKA